MYERLRKYGKSKRWIGICLISLGIIVVANVLIRARNTQEDALTIEKEEIDYSLVYDEETYLENNQDIEEVIGKDSEKLFNHFIQYGMDEGRIASENFDVHYYKNSNSDLAETYGENLRQYYLHYMRYGHLEGRKGSNIILYDIRLKSEIVNEHMLNFCMEVDNKELEGESYYIFALPIYQYTITDGEYLLSGCFVKKGTNVDFECDVRDNLNKKYVVAQKASAGYKIVSNDSYICNAEVLCQTNIKRLPTYSKKGLQVASITSDDSDNVLEELEILNPSYPFTNLIIENIMYPRKVDENIIIYTYNDKQYYFREDVILKYDKAFATLTKRGASITASILSVKREGFEELYYPGISMDTGASFYAINTTTSNGVTYLEAFVSFMAERYNGTSEDRGLIANWIIGNEVNESGTYNYMGEKNINAYLKEYTRTFRIIYNVVKSNIGIANVYIPMEPWWGIGSNNLTYGGREFLNCFNKLMYEEGDIEWGLAYHAYSYPLSDPKVLNDTERTTDENGGLTLDGYVTTDSDRSVIITMENIEVLINYMHQKEFLNKNGLVRSIILSEQGYTSNSNLYGKCEAQQAASMVYAYYKAEMLEDIDAFIYFVQRDNIGASLGNEYYLFGLEGENEDGSFKKKLSYEVYQVMDTKYAIQELWYIKNILGIEAWDEIITDFDEALFTGWNEWNIANNVKKDISLAMVEEIKAQKYTGSECLPEVSVSIDGIQLINDIDYDVVYMDNISVGVAKMVIVGLNNYCGIKEVSFMIQ